MKVLAYRGAGSLVLEERPQPHPGPGEVVVKVGAASICGTDLRIAAGQHSAYVDGDGRVPGHEMAGTVAETGAGAVAREGERVFVAPNYGCGACRSCRRGLVNLCEHPRALGITDDGAFAEYLLAPKELVAQGNLMSFNGDVDPAAVALVEPLACALRGSQACLITVGEVVLVYGAGPIGLLHVTLARLAGASAVVVCEPNGERQGQALAWGASAVCGPGKGEVRSSLVGVGAKEGADAVIVAAPVPQAQAEALELAAPCGRVNFFAGLPRGRSRTELDTNLIHYKELVVTGTTASNNSSCRAALDLVMSGRVTTAALVQARVGLSAAGEAFELAGSGRVLKVVVQP